MSERAFGNFPLAYKSKGKCSRESILAEQGKLQVPSMDTLPEVAPSSTGEAAFSQGSQRL